MRLPMEGSLSRRQSPTVSGFDGHLSGALGKRPLLDIGAAASRLNCSERFVRRLVQERRIPFVKIGGSRVRFLDTDIEDWIVSQRIDSTR
jgi:excisionase family DNA binding protein